MNRTRLLLVTNDSREEGRLRAQLAASAPAVVDVTVAWSAVDGASELASRRYDVLLLDLSMATDGLERFWAVCPGKIALPIVALTPTDDQQLARQAIQHGAQEYLPKNEITTHLLIRAVRYARERFHWLKDRSRQLEHELQMAALIQERFLPSTAPRLAGYEIGGCLHASGQIGGDFYDYIELAHGRTGVVLGDASGKGIPGALLMAKAQAIVRAEAASMGTAAEVVTRVNAAIHGDIARDQFVTLFYAVLPAHGREIRYVNAGHPRALLVRRDGIEPLPSTGPPLGVFADAC
jgi:serine phosphatase RsbU (regulator of sigma subunit)